MPIDMNALARAGAEARIKELQAEINEIQQAFPDLERRKASTPTAAPKARRGRKPMSAAARKAVGERMRRYWDSRRKAKAVKGEAAAKKR